MGQPSKESKQKYADSSRAKERKKLYYLANIDRWRKYERDRQLKKMYGISSDDYEKMLAAQNGGCKMCGVTRGGPKRQYLVVDHCHRTGRIRGLLCTRCNIAVGFYELHANQITKYLQDD